MQIRTMTLAVVALLPGMMTAGLAAQNGNGKPSTPVTIVSPVPVPVSGTVQAQQAGNWTVGLSGTPTVTLSPTGAPLPVVKVLPSTAFTIPPVPLALSASGSPNQTPDPPGTRYAITSVNVSNPTANMAVLTLTAYSFAGAANCGFIFNVINSAPGPKLTVAPNSSGSLTFPQPYVTDAVTGGPVCLTGAGSNGLGTTWSVVGYKILP
jgi:hypothetical protein